MTIPRVSSALKAVELKQLPPPLIIGERINTQGSRKAKQLVLNDDYDGLVDLARIQVEDGAHCLDVCVATTERADERQFMLNLVKKLSLEIDAPLVIDSTDPDVIEAAVEQIPGRPIINSINLEGDGSRFEKLAPIMAKYGLPAIALCIGPKGMAKTPQEKVETAELLYETGKKYGLKIEQFIFDVLTFTLATGEDEFLDAGKNTLEGIRLVKEKFPNSFTTLGLSNISFGLVPYARKVLNSVFLYHAVKSGLDTAIVNAKEIIPYGEIDAKEKKLAEDLIFNNHPNALSELIIYFEKAGKQDSDTSKKLDVDSTWSPGKRAHFRIVNRLKDGIQNDVVSTIAEKIDKKEIIEDHNGILSLNAPPEITHDGAIRTLNEDLLPAMKEVGDKFGSGELILPFVLKSAECMKAAVGELEKYLIKEEGSSKGKLVLGTVYGDVHDIGKNLVKTIFQNNGYTVYDLGKQVPLQKFLEKIDEVKPDALGLSALLVSTSKQMQ
ncbi:MAG: dihydropteroate synthase, partial [Nitrosarchaeum sp.]|nr:dihydropteroate synthase [Nitrosarchaeum sp.]